MNKILPLLKSNWVILVCLIVPIGAIAAGWIFSGKWNASIREKVEQSVSSDMRQIGGLSQSFEIPQLDPKAEPISFTMVPNRRTVELAGEKLRSNIQQSERIFDLAVEHNSKGKSLLIDGPTPEDKLFPTPSSTQSRLDKLARLPDAWKQAHTDLLDGVRAGDAPDPADVVEAIEQFIEQERDRFMVDRVDQTLSEEEQETIDARARERRAELYRNRAADITFYASPSVFAGVFDSGEEPERAPGRPGASSAPPPRLDLARAWEWQHRFWVHEEIMRALKAANTEAGSGLRIPAHRGAVKRVLSINAEEWDLSASANDSVRATDASSEIPRDPNLSLSGLTSWPEAPNQLYDVRDATVRLHVASRAINRVMEALKAQNFIKINSMQIAEVDEMDELRRGYDYGSDHVVELTLGIQTVWLREWTKQSMPPAVRTALGIPQEEPNEEGEGA